MQEPEYCRFLKLERLSPEDKNEIMFIKENLPLNSGPIIY